MRLCFAFEDAAIVHLAPYPPQHEMTLCGKRAFAASLQRRKITCPVCLARKPKVMGGKP